MDSGNHRLFVFQPGRFCCNQSQNHLLVPGYLCQRFKTTGTLIIKFQIIGIYIFFPEKHLCHCIISTLIRIGRMKITAAYMGIDNHILRRIFNNLIIDILMCLLNLH